MAFRMGFSNYEIMGNISPKDLPIVMETIPSKPLVTQEEWEAIVHYYIEKAPDSLLIQDKFLSGDLDQFEVHPSISFKAPFVTVIKFDTLSQTLFVGNRASKLYELDPQFLATDSFQLNSPPSHIMFEQNQKLISLMGIMDPNDQAKGELVILPNSSKVLQTILDSLQRPVHFEKADLNKDGHDDIVVCSFGNYTGGLLLFEGQESGQWVKHSLNAMPGARKVTLLDFNKDGLTDILVLMTQGDERLVAYVNKGDLKFEEKILLRFPPVYGSNYFEIADMNNDGYDDIIYVGGDNGDYSIILKPYHGPRIYENDGKNNFKETWSFSMAGASQSAVRDFDKDGDLDVAVIAFFPDFKKHPDQSFIYFENIGNYKFIPHTTPLAATGRWLVMETADYDRDGDFDIILGSANFKGLGFKGADLWPKGQGSLLIFQNKAVVQPVARK